MPEKNENPLLKNALLPKYQSIQAEHVVPAVEAMLTELANDLKELEKAKPNTYDGLIVPLMEMGQKLHNVWSPVNHLHHVKDSQELREAHAQMEEKVVEFSMRLGQSEEVYAGLKALKESPKFATFDEGKRRLIEQRLVEAKLSGVDLKGEKKEELNRLVLELSQLSTRFANNLLDSTKEFSLVLKTKEEAQGLTSSFLAAQSQAYAKKFPQEKTSAENGPWLITLDAPCFIPFMENSQDRKLREKIYRAHLERASKGEHDNREIIVNILKGRKKKAELLGFNNYSELSLSRKMAGRPTEVYTLLEELRLAAFEPAKKELEEIEAYAKSRGFKEQMRQWDLAYWAKRYQEHLFQFNDEELRPYFPLPQVLEGLFALVEKLFAIRVKAADGEAEVWNKDVRFFNIFDNKNVKVASFFLDPYSRLGEKRGGAWMDECQVRRRTADGLILPIAYLVCNMAAPVGDEPSLLTFSDVETLFHEFGHGLQHMLSQVDEADVSGINGIEWDAVELPSQFMENWCYHEKTLLGLARHYKTKEVLPKDLFNKIIKAKNYRSAQMMLRQLQFALVDMDLHGPFDPFGTKTPFDLQKEVAKKTAVMPPLEEDYFLCGFSHIFAGGYASAYYSYKWAEVLSADAFSAFEDVGLENETELKACGLRFRDTVLALGGSRHPMDVFVAFRGRKPETKALLRHSGLA